MDARLSNIATLAKAMPREYTPADHNWNPTDAEELTSLGTGGSSVVLPMLYRRRLKRAVKIYYPRDDLRANLDLAHFVASYENEIERQAAISHQNISKITDFAFIEVDGERYPYLATEYIDGLTLKDFSKAPETTGEELLQVLDDVLDGLGYLHEHGVMHCDVKQDNILVQMGARPTGVLVDLGSSRFFPEDSKTEAEDEYLYLFTTTRYVPSRLQPLVSNWSKNRILRSELRKYFPYFDLHAFGVMLEDFMGDPETASKLRRTVGSGAGATLVHIRAKLKNPRPGAAYFQTAEEVRSSLKRAGKHSLAVFNIPELALAPEKGVFLPNSAGRVHGTGRVDRIMSHPLFQRFHNLPQLDLLHWTLPGATSTRYVHATRSYETTREALGYLLNNWRFRLDVTSKDIESMLFGSLLNQMGHYHFLHMFEDFIGARETDHRIGACGLLNDEELLDSILGLRDSPIGEEVAAIEDERGRTLRDIVSSLGIDWADVRRRQRSPESPLQGLLAGLLSGPVDVEKLAYLRDDSTSTGVQFGIGLTGSPIFESLVIPHEDDWKLGGVSRTALGVTEQAMSYLEHGVLTRYWNIQTAYWNRTNRAVQSMVKFQIAALIGAGLLDFGNYVRSTLHLSADGALRWLDAQYRYAQDDNMIDPQWVNPMDDLLASRRVIYRRLVTISGKSIVPDREPDYRIYRRVQGQSPLDDSRIYEVVEEALGTVLPARSFRRGEILLDLPRAPRDETRGRVLVYTDDGQQLMGELFSISPNLHQHQMSFEQYVKRMRIYLHPALHEQIRSTGRLRQAYDAVLGGLRETYPN